jgi:hypothetical protein
MRQLSHAPKGIDLERSLFAPKVVHFSTVARLRSLFQLLNEDVSELNQTRRISPHASLWVNRVVVLKSNLSLQWHVRRARFPNAGTN